MNATLLNGSVIGEQCIVGAGALITQGKEFEPRSLIFGAPARRVRSLTEAELDHLSYAADHYEHAGRLYKQAGWDLRTRRG